MEYRIVELPAIKMARSGDQNIWEFEKWWTSLEENETPLFPRDFWWNNEKTGRPEWLYALPKGVLETNGYEILDFPGGLYAVTTTYDNDDEKTKTYLSLKKWIEDGDRFDLANEKNDPSYHRRYGMGHVSTPKDFRNHEFTMFIPIVYRNLKEK